MGFVSYLQAAIPNMCSSGTYHTIVKSDGCAMQHCVCNVSIPLTVYRLLNKAIKVYQNRPYSSLSVHLWHLLLQFRWADFLHTLPCEGDVVINGLLGDSASARDPYHEGLAQKVRANKLDSFVKS